MASPCSNFRVSVSLARMADRYDSVVSQMRSILVLSAGKPRLLCPLYSLHQPLYRHLAKMLLRYMKLSTLLSFVFCALILLNTTFPVYSPSLVVIIKFLLTLLIID